MTASFNSDNWEAYLEGFRSHFRELNATDPDRFPKGKKFSSSQVKNINICRYKNVFPQTEDLATVPGSPSLPS